MTTRRLFIASIIALFALVNASNSLLAEDLISLSQAEVNSLYRTTSRGIVSVHDPSVVHASGKTYYALGSHRAFVRSTDNMVNWQGVSNNIFGRINSSGQVELCDFSVAYSTNETKKVKALVNGEVQEVTFGNFDAADWAHGNQDGWNIGGNMWAPDIIWNPTMKKWCMYMSLNGDSWHSVIVLMTADQITGPYVYQGPVTYSGFINTTTPEISWKKTDLELVLGTQSTLPARYDRGGAWGDYWPNDIDPCVIFDDDSQMWMTYGSWSGGIFMLKLDKETGLRDYTVTYPITLDNSGRALTDPYFGKRIAGGYYSSGEASYIQKIGDYYYLFMSYGGLQEGGNPDDYNFGGYEIAIFRSEKPDGPYLDARNLDALYNGRYWLNFGPNANTTGGMRPFGAYADWGFMTVGELAQGHNSAIVDEQGRAFIVYHTRFSIGGGFEMRTHQLFSNKDGWLCAAPFQFDGETENDDSIAKRCLFTEEQIAGEYDVLIHRYKLNHMEKEVVTPIHLTLTNEGKVTGDLSGSWAMTEGTGYIRVTAGGVAYNGVVIQQQMDGTTMQAICFTGTANNGVSIWGCKPLPQYAVAYTAQKYELPVKSGQTINSNVPLYGNGYFGATIEWESSEPSIISNNGRFCPVDTITPIVLTCRIKAENYVYEREIEVKAQREIIPSGDCRSGLVAFYNFDDKPTYNLYNEDQNVFYYYYGGGTTPTLETDPARDGQIVRIYPGGQSAFSFARMPNPLLGHENLEGFTISAWVYREDAEDLFGTLWAFTDNNVSRISQIKQRMYLTGNTFVGFEDGTNYFDYNRPEDDGSNPTDYIPTGTWSLVTLTASVDDGISIYVNGSKKTIKSFASSAGSASYVAGSAKLFDYNILMDFVTTAEYLSIGAGSLWGSASALYDNFMVYDRALSTTDIRCLNTLSNRVTDFGPSADGISTLLATPSVTNRGIYDLHGRSIPDTRSLQPGFYIIQGRKVLIK